MGGVVADRGSETIASELLAMHPCVKRLAKLPCPPARVGVPKWLAAHIQMRSLEVIFKDLCLSVVDNCPSPDGSPAVPLFQPGALSWTIARLL